MELVEAVLYVSDMERAIHFYRDVLRLELGFENERWTTFRTGACTLALHGAERREPGVGEPDPTFRVQHAATERARLEAAGVEVTEIREPVAGVLVFDIRDPDSQEQKSSTHDRGGFSALRSGEPPFRGCGTCDRMTQQLR